MRRRQFIKTSAAGIALPTLIGGMPVSVNSMESLGGALAAVSDKVLVVIQLEGGNDGVNMLVPVDQYAELNAIRASVLPPENQLLSLSGLTDVKLHPQMTALRDLYNDGKILFLQSVGYSSAHSSSHPSATRQVLNGYGDVSGQSGWLGRFMESIHPGYTNFANFPNNLPAHPLSVEFGSYNSLLTQGYTGSMSVLLNTAQQFAQLFYNCNNNIPNEVSNGCDLTSVPPGMSGAVSAREKLLYLRSFSRLIEHYACVLADHFTASSYESCIAFNACPDSELQKQLRIVADWIKNGLQTKVYLVRQGGYDTHGAQPYVHGINLQTLSVAIKSFLENLGSAAGNVVGLVVTEFGRTLKTNGSTGTDHATAYPTFLFGDNVAGGILGETPTIPTPAQLDDDLDFYNNMAVQHDIRRIYSTLLKHWFCMTNLETATILNPAGQNANIPDPVAFMAANNMVPMPLLDNFSCCTLPPTLSGQPEVCAGGALTYSVEPVAGSFYLWTVTGGEIVAGGGALDHSVTVQWGSGSQGSIQVKLL